MRSSEEFENETLFLEQIRFELQLLFNRVNYLLVGNAFLVTAFATLMSQFVSCGLDKPPDIPFYIIFLLIGISVVGYLLSFLFMIINYQATVNIRNMNINLYSIASLKRYRELIYYDNGTLTENMPPNSIRIPSNIIKDVLLGIVIPFNRKPNAPFSPITVIVPIIFVVFWLLMILMQSIVYYMTSNICFMIFLCILILATVICFIYYCIKVNKNQSNTINESLSTIQEVEMPKMYKILAEIVIWILFVFGCMAVLGGFVRIGLLVCNIGSAVPEARLIGVYFAAGVVSLILSAVAIKIRKSLE